jgi:hypothetical protein
LISAARTDSFSLLTAATSFTLLLVIISAELEEAFLVRPLIERVLYAFQSAVAAGASHSQSPCQQQHKQKVITVVPYFMPLLQFHLAPMILLSSEG